MLEHMSLRHAPAPFTTSQHGPFRVHQLLMHHHFRIVLMTNARLPVAPSSTAENISIIGAETSRVGLHTVCAIAELPRVYRSRLLQSLLKVQEATLPDQMMSNRTN